MSHLEGHSNKTQDGQLYFAAQTPEQKRRVVRRMLACDGLLACHALQGCIQRYLLSGGANHSGVAQQRLAELEAWLIPVLDTITDCLCQVKNGVSESTATARGVRCATFLLQVCSTMLKTQRGTSHPERANPSLVPAVLSSNEGVPSANDFPRETGVSGDGDALADYVNSDCEHTDAFAADTSAEIATRYLSRMLQAAIKDVRKENAENLSELTGSEGRCGGGDTVFWVLSFLSDVLKNFSKRAWTFSAESHVITHAHGIEGATVTSTTEAIRDLITDGREHDSVTAASGKTLDVAGLAAAVAAVPIARALGMVDVALKWLEVTKLLLDAAEATKPEVLPDMITTLCQKLWRLLNHGEPSLPLAESARRPGSAFVEDGGADGALYQAMLSILFRTILLQIKTGLLDAQKEAEANVTRSEGKESTSTNDTDCSKHLGEKRDKAPWSSTTAALLAVCTSSGQDHVRAVNATFETLLIRVFCDQDDALVDMLLINLHIYLSANNEATAVGSQWRILSDIYCRHLHPAALFAVLLIEVGFDSGVLLDWLISPETRFLLYLTLFLRYAVAEWFNFAMHVSGANSAQYEKHGTGSNIATDNEDEEEWILSEPEAERLGMVLSCLAKLAASARDLKKSRLLPYNLSPLLKLIDELWRLYEQCGDPADFENSDVFLDDIGHERSA